MIEPTGSNDVESTLHVLADLSAAAIAPFFRAALTVDDKAGPGRELDPVTQADRAGEAAIVAHLKRACPNDRIIGEEFGAQGGTGPRTWVIDPIDGTRAFIIGAPTWGTLIGVTDGERAIAGLMNQPYTSERFWSDGEASFARFRTNEHRVLKTDQTKSSLAEAYLTTTSPDLFAADFEAERFAALRARVRTARYGLDCYGYCLLAGGMLDLVVEAGLRSYDIVALVPIIEQAGGVVTTWDGGSPLAGGRIVAAGNRKLHAAALEILAGT